MIAREAIRGVKGRPWMDLAPMRSVAGRGTSEKKNGGEEEGRKEGVHERNRASPLGGCHLPRLEESRKIRGKNQAAANRHATRVQRFFFKGASLLIDWTIAEEKERRTSLNFRNL